MTVGLVLEEDLDKGFIAKLVALLDARLNVIFETDLDLDFDSCLDAYLE